MKFIIYKDRKKQFRWRLVAKNGNIIADSGEGYTRRRSIRASIILLCDGATAPVIDTTIKKK
jgi:uncharacterized protein YegP (UPF0339 family)